MTTGCGDLEVLSNVDGHSLGRVGTSIGRRGKCLTRLGLIDTGEHELQKASRDNSFQKFYSKTKQKNRTVAGGGSGSKRLFSLFSEGREKRHV